MFDVANIDQKDFSERIVSSPVSPLGQRTYVRTPFATSIALPSTLLNDPMRIQNPANEEQPIPAWYGYAFVTDRKLGLSAAALAHRYALSMDGVDTVVLGCKNRKEVLECVDAADAGPLKPAIMAQVDAAFSA